MSRTTAQRATSSDVPQDTREKTISATRAAIRELLDQLRMRAGQPEKDERGNKNAREDFWSQYGRYAGDARFFDGEAWVGFGLCGAPSLAEAERRVLAALKLIAGAV